MVHHPDLSIPYVQLLSVGQAQSFLSLLSICIEAFIPTARVVCLFITLRFILLPNAGLCGGEFHSWMTAVSRWHWRVPLLSVRVECQPLWWVLKRRWEGLQVNYSYILQPVLGRSPGKLFTSPTTCAGKLFTSPTTCAGKVPRWIIHISYNLCWDGLQVNYSHLLQPVSTTVPSIDVLGLGPWQR